MMNETMKPLYSMDIYELITEAGIIQDKINMVCYDLQGKNYDMDSIDQLAKKYESDKPVFSMTKDELIGYIREKYILYDKVCACLDRIPDVFDDRGIDTLIQAYCEECNTTDEPELIIPTQTKKKDDKEVLRLNSFISNYTKYRQLQSEVVKKKEINIDNSSLDLLRDMVLNRKP